MERLTEYMGNGKDYESINPIDTPYEYGKANLQALINKLAAIIEQYGIEEASITGISEADDINCFCFEVYIDPDCHEIIALEEFNDTWFLTKEEAEAKLKEMEDRVNGNC